MKKIRLAITGCRGIPNHYGGFEQFASFLAPALVARGFDVSVYCSSLHPYKKDFYQGVRLIHCADPEDKIGVAGQIYYDLACIWHCRKLSYDIIFQLGYTSCGLWQFLLPGQSKIVSNMDGMEWKRAKYGSWVRKFLRFSEEQVAKRSDHLIGDAEPIRYYLENSYATPCSFIPYAVDIPEHFDPAYLAEWNLQVESYFLLIARIQADNHIEMAIQARLAVCDNKPLVIVGNTKHAYGQYLLKKYGHKKEIMFLGSIFDKAALDALRYFAALYVHGHSAGGTNPSLLEAMAASSLICAHDNRYNRSVCGEAAYYFKDADVLARHLTTTNKNETAAVDKISENLERIREIYTPDNIAEDYAQLFDSMIQNR